VGLHPQMEYLWFILIIEALIRSYLK
jgi:hypothetical protein